MWGIYYKPDFAFGGIQGGAMPYKVDKPAEAVALDPYGPQSTEFIASPAFRDMWTSALAFCHKRFEGKAAHYREEHSGGPRAASHPTASPSSMSSARIAMSSPTAITATR